MSFQDSFLNLSKLLEAAKTTGIVTEVLRKRPYLWPSSRLSPLKTHPSYAAPGPVTCPVPSVDSGSQTDNGASSSFVSF